MTVINTNVASLNAQAALTTNSRGLSKAMEQLSTGKRINSAADDAAGIAIASRLTAQIRGLNQAIRNANDGISMIQTAEGATNEISNMLQRMRELTVQAANDTNSTDDRTALKSEYDQLANEINRIAQTTTWNGMTVLNNGASGATERTTVAFKAMKAGDAVTVGNRTFSATSALSAADVATAFSSGSSTGGTFSGSLGNWTAGAVSNTSEVTFTSTTPNSNVTDLTVTRNLSAPTVTTTTGRAAPSWNVEVTTPGADSSKETQKVTVGAMAAGDTFTIAGQTLTAKVALTAAQVATAFAQGNQSSDFTLSGTRSTSWAAPTVDGSDNTKLVYEGAANGDISGFVAVASTSAKTTSAVSFSALLSGDRITVGGVTLTASADLTAENVASAFAGTSVTGASMSGDNSAWTATRSGSVVSFEANDYGATSGLAASVGAAAALTKTKVEGSAGTGTFTFQLGASGAAQNQVSISFGDFSTGGSIITVSTSDQLNNTANATANLARIDSSIGNVNAARSNMGSYINRFQYTIDNLTNISTNAAASRSRIEDADYSQATTELAKRQVIQQAATAMLAQANQQPQSVLTLLK